VNAWSQARGGGMLATALARAEAWLLEPPAPRAPAPPIEPPRRPVVVVRGLARGGGASTVARALAATLARGDPAGAAVVVGGPPGAGPRIAAPAAVRAARQLDGLGCQAARATGRVCVLSDGEPLAAVAAARAWPVVVDVAHASPPAEGLGHADLAVIVTSPAVEAALAVAVESSLVAAGHRVEVVVNRVDWREPADGEPAGSRASGALGAPLEIGESRFAAQLALACREARGPFAKPIAELAERCRAAAGR
jgi:hypothetical protein